IYTSSTDIKIARNTTRSTQALNVSEAGISAAINHLRNNPSWGPNNLDTVSGGTWATQSAGTVALPNNVNGSYAVTVYDSIGSNGRTNNNTRPASEMYTTLGSSDVLLEATGTVAGVTRKVGLIVRTSISAFDYATYSDSQIDGTGSGSNPGTFIGKLYAGSNMQLQGNYGLTGAEAESPGTITPDCNSGKFQSCNDSATAVEAPVLDFAYYQNQSNFPTQQVYKMTPGVGSATVSGSTTTWPVTFNMTTLGNSYTISATMKAVKVGSTYNHTAYWCANKANASTGATVTCSDGGTPITYTFSSDKAETGKPYVNAAQFNDYTAFSGSYTSSVVNVFDATNHLEFLGPNSGTVTVTASILVGTAANNTEPIGKIDFEGGAGTLNLQPANGIAVVAEKVEFKAKYSSINVNVGTASAGAVIVATQEFGVEAKSSNTATLNMNGSVVVGNGENDGNFDIGGNGVSANFTYTKVNNLPQGWQNYGSLTITRREWRELT
ncbi:MAG: hypothetical protein HZB83_03990, partial [Deltaproteobacteria bacterium]|nr:hypothetical protein [Deltaproteobacteria bacterium]